MRMAKINDKNIEVILKKTQTINSENLVLQLNLKLISNLLKREEVLLFLHYNDT